MDVMGSISDHSTAGALGGANEILRTCASATVGFDVLLPVLVQLCDWINMTCVTIFDMILHIITWRRLPRGGGRIKTLNCLGRPGSKNL